MKLKKNKKYNLIFAKVISYNYISSKILINKGSNDKVFIGQAVINEKGIIGQTVLVSKNFSYVMLIHNKIHSIPVKLLNNNINFILHGSGNCEILFSNNMFILFNEDIKEGDLLVSSGLDNIFPKNYPVAYVSKIKINNTKFYINITAKSAFRIKDLDYIALINYDN